MSTTPTPQISTTDVVSAINEGLVTNYPTNTMTFDDRFVRSLASQTSDSTGQFYQSGTRISMNDMRNKLAPKLYGTLISQTCVGPNNVITRADGKYGTYLDKSDTNSILCIPTTITIYFLVVGGGASGGGSLPDDRGGGGGGGGGGGIATGNAVIAKGNPYFQFDVGTGGSAVGLYYGGINGNASYLNFTRSDGSSGQIAAYGGGYGGNGNTRGGGYGGYNDFPDAKTGNAGGAAGPGGGGGYNYAGGGNGASGKNIQGARAYYWSGGGGGGGSDDYPPTGKGGDGYYWYITDKYYGGGGGGGGDYSGTASGGKGGGADGRIADTLSGTDGLGGGGAGGSSAADSAWGGGKGGDGVIIIAYNRVQQGTDWGRFLSGGTESATTNYYIHTFTSTDVSGNALRWIK